MNEPTITVTQDKELPCDYQIKIEFGGLETTGVYCQTLHCFAVDGGIVLPLGKKTVAELVEHLRKNTRIETASFLTWTAL